MPERPIGNPLIPYDSPLHVSELFLQILKISFEDLPPDYPFRYVRDNIHKTGICFDVSLNKDAEVFGKKPLVIVNRSTQSLGITTTGDLAAVNLPNQLKIGTNMSNNTLLIQVVSKTKAEVEIIAQHIFSLIMMCRTHLPRLLGIHMVDSVSMSDVNKMEDDDTMFIAQISFNYSLQYKWSQETRDTVLRSIMAKLEPLNRP